MDQQHYVDMVDLLDTASNTNGKSKVYIVKTHSRYSECCTNLTTMFVFTNLVISIITLIFICKRT